MSLKMVEIGGIFSLTFAFGKNVFETNGYRFLVGSIILLYWISLELSMKLLRAGEAKVYIFDYAYRL